MAKTSYIIWVLIGIMVAGLLAPLLEEGMILFLGYTANTGDTTIDALIPIILIMAIIGVIIGLVSFKSKNGVS